MVVLSNLMDLDLLAAMIEQRMVTCKEHPRGGMFILNYTPAAQYSSTWNEVTRQCRGLIVGNDPTKGDSVVLARPFPKFYNVGEYGTEKLGDLPLDQPFDVFAKMDGSLGILYTDPVGLPAIATRGSFVSDQALWATKRYRETYNAQAPPGVTLLFEIIYPENRIVVDYGDQRDLVLLAAIDIMTGADRGGYVLPSGERGWPGSVVKQYDGLKDIAALTVLAARSPAEWANTEGFVLRFHEPEAKPSVRVKIKFSEYVRLHRLVTGVTAKTIWELLMTGSSIEELLDRVPDEFFQWVKDTAHRLQIQHDSIEQEARTTFNARPVGVDRKTMAAYFSDKAHKAVLFRMLDGRDYHDIIWRSIKPQHERPFKTDVDA